MFRKWRGLPVLLALALVLAACGSAGTPSAGGKADPKPAAAPEPAKASPTPSSSAPSQTTAPAQPQAVPKIKFPEQPVRIVQTHPPGGAVDIPLRLLQPHLEAALGQPVILEPKPGSAGTTALEFVWKAKPDGYTLGTTLQTILDGGKINPGASYDPVKFAPVATVIGKGYQIVLVRKDAPWKTFKELVADALKRPGEIGYGGAGVGSLVVFGLTETRSKAKFNFIPYSGGGDVMKALLGREVDVATTTLGSFKQLTTDDTRILAVMGDERDPFIPDIPTTREQGYDIVVDVANVVVAPPGTPPEVLQVLGDAFKKAVSNPDYQAAAKKGYMTPWVITGQEFQRWHEKVFQDILSVEDAVKPKQK